MPQGQGTTFQFTTGVPLDFREFIDMLDPIELALQNMHGSDGRGVIPKETSTQVKIEWQSEQILLPASTLDAAVSSTSATTVKVQNVTSGADYDHKLKFQTGSVLKVGDELLRVTGYNSAEGTLDVERGFGGTSAATHSDDDPIFEVGHVLPEGSDPQERRFLDRSSDHNFHQIFGPVGVKISGTRQAVPRFGVPAGQELAKQTTNRLIELAHSVEQALLYGTRYNDTTEERRMMGGMFYFATTTVDSTSTDLAESGEGPTPVIQMLSDMYDQGQRGRRLRAFHHPGKGQKIDTWDNTKIRLSRTETERGETVWSLATRYGIVDFIMSDHVQPSDMIIVDREQPVIKTLPGRDYQFVPEGKRGDYWEGFVLCEKSLEFTRPEHAGKFTNLA